MFTVSSVQNGTSLECRLYIHEGLSDVQREQAAKINIKAPRLQGCYLGIVTHLCAPLGGFYDIWYDDGSVVGTFNFRHVGRQTWERIPSDT